MDISGIFAAVSAVVSVVSLLTVFVELRSGRLQRKAESLIQVYDANRELLTLGFDKPELFDVIGTGDYGHRYLQLWVNHIALIVELRRQNLFSPTQWKALDNDIGYFVENPKFRLIWPEIRMFYPRPLQKILDAKIAIVEKKEAAEAITHEASAA